MTVGEVNNRIIAVVYTPRGDKIRIISARKARKNEERKYRSIQG
ncbi:MAG: BrnT family toxin [Waddliaceae bacterium]